MRKILLLAMLFLIIFGDINSQVNLTVSSHIVEPNEPFEVEVSVSGFEDIAAFQFQLNYDPTCIKIEGISEIFADAQYNISNIGKIFVIWIDLSTLGKSLNENGLLLKFKASSIDNTCKSTTFNFTNVEFVSINSNDQDGVEYNTGFIAIINVDSIPDFIPLLEFYLATSGPNWLNNGGWSDALEGNNLDPCSWFGVRCNEQGRVDALDLDGNPTFNFGDEGQGNNLIGNIIDIDLPFLEFLDLSNNSLEGEIPDFSKLTKLEVLNLNYNNLSGEIPNFKNIPKLKTLNASNNELKETIPDFINLPELQTLDLASNNFSAELPEFLNLNALDTLVLSENNFSGCVPFKYCDYSSVILDNNPLLPWKGNTSMICQNIENQIFAPCEDRNFDTNNEMITPDCSCLEIFSDQGQYEDYLALIEIFDATNGMNWKNNSGWKDGKLSIDFDYCNWFGVSCNENGRVESLVLSKSSMYNNNGNNLTGEIPDINLPFLEFLDLSRNELSGQIPDFSKAPRLTHLLLGSNNLEGFLPDFSNMPKLINLTLNSNELEGSLPNFSNLPKLSKIEISDNKLSGHLTEFTKLPGLDTLLLSNNNFSGCVPMLYCDYRLLDISKNPKLPGKGDMEKICGKLYQQKGAPCDDGDFSTILDEIDAECNCEGKTIILSDYKYLEPQQDCTNSIFLCNKESLMVQYVNGIGEKDEFSPDYCLDKELSSSWFSWVCDQSGTLTFEISPLNINGFGIPDDLDFILFRKNSNVGSCEDMEVIRCMASGAFTDFMAQFWTNCHGKTGLKEGNEDVIENIGCIGMDNNFLAPLEMQAGETYVLVVTNFTSSGLGFTLDFGGTGTFTSAEKLQIDCQIKGKPGRLNGDCECEEYISEILLTNIITPDGDGLNDALRFNNLDIIENSEIWIYNRWGNEIYHSRDYKNDWQGEGFPGGVYFYILNYDGNNYKSSFTILK